MLRLLSPLKFSRSYSAQDRFPEHMVLSFYRLTVLHEKTLEPMRAEFLRALTHLGVRGRIYIGREGINAQVALPKSSLSPLRAFMDPRFEGLFYNVTTASEGNEDAFEKLQVKIRPQIVADGLGEDACNVALQPECLAPAAFHAALSRLAAEEPGQCKDGSPVLLDVRNSYEIAIGHFQVAATHHIPSQTFRGYMRRLSADMASWPKTREILMCCTGGIRCSKAGAYLRTRGFENVKMLQGGITNYANYILSTAAGATALSSLFRGKNFTFDQRRGEPVTSDILGSCEQCQSAWDGYVNCILPSCNKLFIQCPACSMEMNGACSEQCHQTSMDEEQMELHRALGSSNRIKAHHHTEH